MTSPPSSDSRSTLALIAIATLLSAWIPIPGVDQAFVHGALGAPLTLTAALGIARPSLPLLGIGVASELLLASVVRDLLALRWPGLARAVPWALMAYRALSGLDCGMALVVDGAVPAPSMWLLAAQAAAAAGAAGVLWWLAQRADATKRVHGWLFVFGIWAALDGLESIWLRGVFAPAEDLVVHLLLVMTPALAVAVLGTVLSMLPPRWPLVFVPRAIALPSWFDVLVASAMAITAPVGMLAEHRIGSLGVRVSVYLAATVACGVTLWRSRSPGAPRERGPLSAWAVPVLVLAVLLAGHAAGRADAAGVPDDILSLVGQ